MDRSGWGHRKKALHEGMRYEVTSSIACDLCCVYPTVWMLRVDRCLELFRRNRQPVQSSLPLEAGAQVSRQLSLAKLSFNPHPPLQVGATLYARHRGREHQSFNPRPHFAAGATASRTELRPAFQSSPTFVCAGAILSGF